MASERLLFWKISSSRKISNMLIYPVSERYHKLFKYFHLIDTACVPYTMRKYEYWISWFSLLDLFHSTEIFRVFIHLNSKLHRVIICKWNVPLLWWLYFCWCNWHEDVLYRRFYAAEVVALEYLHFQGRTYVWKSLYILCENELSRPFTNKQKANIQNCYLLNSIG